MLHHFLGAIGPFEFIGALCWIQLVLLVSDRTVGRHYPYLNSVLSKYLVLLCASSGTTWGSVIRFTVFGFRIDSISVTTSGDVSCLTFWSLPESSDPELEQSRRMASLKMLLNTINGFATEMLFVPSALPFTHLPKLRDATGEIFKVSLRSARCPNMGPSPP